MHLFNECLEALFDVSVGERGALAHVDELLAHHELLYFFCGDLSLVRQVALVRHYADLH